MANTREVLNDRFVAFSGIAKRQSARGTGLANSDIDTRHKCTIAREEVIERRQYRDCRDEDLTGSKIQGRFARWTFTYAEITAGLIAFWSALKLSAAAAPSGTPADEVQTLSRSGTVNAGFFTIALTLEGRTVTTKPIAWNASNADIQAALTAARMLFIQPGDVTVGGTWGGGVTLTFANSGRLGRTNLPLVAINNAPAGVTAIGGGGSVAVAETTPGDQNYHAFSRSTTRQLALFSFALGWDTDIDRVEKFIDAAVESLNATISLDGNVGFTATVITPWEYDSIETAFDIPECESIEALQAQDCRVQIDGVWQTEDINSLSVPVGNAIPTDRLSAFPFDGIDIQRTERGRQPVYGPIAASIFGSEVDSIYQLAQNERTEDPVDVKIHFGFPGNRCSWLFPNSRVMFGSNRMGEAGEARYATMNLEIQPEQHSTDPVFEAEAFIDQATAFLTT